MPEKAVDSRAIAAFWNLSCSLVGAEVFPNKKQESNLRMMLNCLCFFGVFAENPHFLGNEGRICSQALLLPYFSA